MNPYGDDLIVDQVIGSAYQVVKYVAANMTTLIELSDAMDTIQSVLDQLQDLITNLPQLLELQENLDELLLIHSHLNELLNINSHMTELLAINGALDEILTVYNNLPAIVNAATSVTTAREALRRSYAEIGYDLVAGSFEDSGTVTTPTDLLLYEAEGQAYSWTGSYPVGGKVVPIGSSPYTTGGVSDGAWRPVWDITLREELAASSGAGLVGGVPIPAADARFSGGSSPSNPDNKLAFDSILESGETVRFERGTHLISGVAIVSNGERISIEGEGGDSVIKLSSTGAILSVTSAEYVAIRKMLFDMTQAPSAGTTHGLVFIDQPNLTLEKVNIIGTSGIGSSLISYSADGTQIPYAVIRDARVRGLRESSSNTNGVLLVDGIYSTIDNVDALGYAAFAIELKSVSEYNRISNSIARFSNGGLYYGSSEANKYPRVNVASNIIAEGCDYGYVPGLGDHNVLVGYLCDTNGALGTKPEGMRCAGNNNLTLGMSFKGAINDDAVRLESTSYNNVTSFKYSPGTDALSKAVVLEAGARRNATEILHPGKELVSIVGHIGNASGMSMSGVDANPIWCHATGEYYGSLGSGWKWVHAASTATRSSTHKWRFEGAGDSLLSIATDGVGSSGLNITSTLGSRNLLWNEASQFWQLDGPSYNVRFYSNTIRPGADNTMDFGTASLRGRVAYFATGTINTSDAREKTAPLAISDAVLDAWGDVQLVAFQWLSAIQQKGEDVARWHFGVIAQQVRDAFIARGLDGTRYGLLCYDEWGDEFEDVIDDVGNKTGKQRLVLAAGNRWGIRADQCLFLEAAYQRRRCERIEARLYAAGL